MDPSTYDNFSWLTSVSAEEHLRIALKLFEKNLNPLKTAKLLRKTISPQRAAMVMEQAQLRIRGKRKFPDAADAMFFTGRSLEQSTSALIANYKAKRFNESTRVADLCCGIGGDLISLANRNTANPNFETVGVDSDPVASCFAAANVNSLDLTNTRVECAPFESFDLKTYDGIHVDPDRRTKGRTVKGNFFEPSLESVFERLALDRQLVGIKVAPATELESQDFPVQREWIGGWRECKQQVLWAGPQIEEGSKIATVVAKDGAHCHFRYSDSAEQAAPPKMAETIGPYIYEPHASILAAGLGQALAEKHSMQYLARGIAYMNSDRVLSEVEPILKGYRVDKVMAVDLKSIQKTLKQMEVGQLVIKKRGVDQVLADKISRLKLSGDQKATIMLTRHDKSRRAILVTRMVS